MTNASTINMQNSYKTLDCPDKPEGTIFPATKNGVDQKYNLNQSKVLGNVRITVLMIKQSHYVKEEDIKDGFNSH